MVWSPSAMLLNEIGMEFVSVNVPVSTSSPSNTHVPDTFISDVAVKLMVEESYVSYITVFSTTFSLSSFTCSNLPT